MKIHHSYNTEIIGNLKTKNAQIAATPIMFDILSNKIYSDKIAVVRELCTNAIDEHNECGKGNVPIHVHLPTSLEPYFEVKDFGRGMSPEKVIRTYMTYGASDKHDSNISVGCLGLGSKVGFIESDQFTTITRHDGRVYTYLIFKGDDGLIKVSQTNVRKATDEDDFGTIVRVPVAGTEYYRYQKYIIRCSRAFPVKPIVTPELDLSEHDLHIVYQNEFMIITTTKDDFNDNLAVRLGLIDYKVPNYRDYLPNNFFPTGTKVILLADMDDEERRIDFVVSREMVENTPHTKKVIQNLLDKGIAQLKKDLQKEKREVHNLRDRVRLVNSWTSVVVRGRILSSPPYLVPRNVSKGPNCPYATMKLYSKSGNMSGTGALSYTNYEYPHEGDLFVYRDECKYPIKRIKTLMEQYPEATIYVVHPENPQRFTFERAKRFYGNDILRLSDVEYVKKTSSTSFEVKGVRYVCKYYSLYDYQYTTNVFNETSLDAFERTLNRIANSGFPVYLEIERGQLSEFQRYVIRKLNSKNIIIHDSRTPILCIMKTTPKKIREMIESKLMSLDEFIQDRIRDVLKKHPRRIEMEDYQWDIIAKLRHIDENAMKLHKMMKRARNIPKRKKAILHVWYESCRTPIVPIEAEIGAVKERFPLLFTYGASGYIDELMEFYKWKLTQQS